MKPYCVAFASLILAACGGKQVEPEIRIVEVPVAVPVSCVPKNFPAKPDMPDSDEALKAAPDAAARYGLIAAGRVLRIQREAEVEPVLAGCR